MSTRTKTAALIVLYAALLTALVVVAVSELTAGATVAWSAIAGRAVVTLALGAVAAVLVFAGPAVLVRIPLQRALVAARILPADQEEAAARFARTGADYRP